jgi:hypothetical protein
MGLRCLSALRARKRPLRPIVNFFQTNNTFVADQLTVQFQTIDINNSAANSQINVVAGQNAINLKLG